MSLTKKHEDLILKQALVSPINRQPTVHNYAEPQVTVYEVLQSLPEINEQPEFPWETVFIYVTFWIFMIMMALSFWGGLAILILLRG